MTQHWRLKGRKYRPEIGRLTALGEQTEIKNISLHGDTLGGQVSAQGEVSVAEPIHWDLKLGAQQLNPAKKWPSLPGEIDLKLAAKGALKDNGPVLTAQILALEGSLNQQPLSGSGVVEVEGKRVEIRGLALSAGPANLQADGIVGKENQLEWQFVVPNLSAILAGASGAVEAMGTLSGSGDSAVLDTRFSAAKVKMSETLSIQQLRGNSSIDMTGASESVVNIRGNDISVAGNRWDKLSVQAAGKPAKHDLSLNFTGPLAKLTATAAGSWADNQWQGQLQDLQAAGTPAGDWRLNKAVDIVAAANVASASDLCLTSKPASICTTALGLAQKARKYPL